MQALVQSAKTNRVVRCAGYYFACVVGVSTGGWNDDATGTIYAAERFFFAGWGAEVCAFCRDINILCQTP
jgi:hypothetical protein